MKLVKTLLKLFSNFIAIIPDLQKNQVSEYLVSERHTLLVQIGFTYEYRTETKLVQKVDKSVKNENILIFQK